MAERSYNTTEIMEGKPIQDDLIALCEKHNIGERWGFTPKETALYLHACLHPLYQISPKRLDMRRRTD